MNGRLSDVMMGDVAERCFCGAVQEIFGNRLIEELIDSGLSLTNLARGCVTDSFWSQQNHLHEILVRNDLAGKLARNCSISALVLGGVEMSDWRRHQMVRQIRGDLYLAIEALYEKASEIALREGQPDLANLILKSKGSYVVWKSVIQLRCS